MADIRKTPLRLFALQHAAGQDVPQPTYAVAIPLQRAGLMTWTGWVRGLYDEGRFDHSRRGRQITREGQRVLREWEDPGGSIRGS